MELGCIWYNGQTKLVLRYKIATKYTYYVYFKDGINGVKTLRVLNKADTFKPIKGATSKMVDAAVLSYREIANRTVVSKVAWAVLDSHTYSEDTTNE